jgi:3-hydroxy-9,10-secoandrosta-1,3,5(10)-triene-9,17-dione monooxygenase reductase component
MSTVDDFKEALASWASGVAVVATRAGGLIHGLTVSSFTSLSLDPPLVLACLANTTRVLPMITAAGAFSVSVLDREQEATSNYFASPTREPAHELAHIDPAPFGAVAGEGGLPVVADALAHLACTLHAAPVQGDHTIIIGRVTAARARPDGAPLLYHRRRYRQLDEGEPLHRFETLLRSF